MSLVRFYRGSANVSLPAHSEGSIFVIARDDTHGDIYVDVEQGKRLHIVPDSPVVYGARTDFQGQASTLGNLYVITDHVYGNVNGTPLTGTAIAVGTGNGLILDCPVFNLTEYESKKIFWDNKVDAFVESEIDNNGNSELLILTRENYHT